MNLYVPRPLGRLIRSPVLQAIVILSLLWLLFFWRIMTPVESDRLIFKQDSDFMIHLYAPVAYQVDRLGDGELAQWNPYNYGGEPAAANIQTAPFYPVRYTSVLLVGPDGYDFRTYQLETAFHYWLASLGMFAFIYALLRRRWVALVSAALFAYSGYLTGYPMLQAPIAATAAWFPWMLLGVWVLMARRTLPGLALTAAAVALMLTAGSPQTAYHLAGAGVLYALWLGWQQRVGWIALFWRPVAAYGLGFALAAAQLLPLAELLGESFRGQTFGYADMGTGFALTETFRLLYPAMDGGWSPLYVGTAGLAFGLIGWLAARRADSHPRFWLVIGVGALLLSFGANTIAYDLLYTVIPGGDLFRQQERLASLITFVVIMGAAYALARLYEPDDDSLKRGASRVIYGYAALAVAVFFVASIVNTVTADDVIRLPALNSLGHMALTAALLAALWRFVPRPSPLVIGVLLLVAFDLFTVARSTDNLLPDTAANRLSPPEPLAPLAGVPPDDVRWRIDGAVGLQGRGTLFRLPDIYGANPIHLEAVERLYKLPVERMWEVFAVRYVTLAENLPETLAGSAELRAYGVAPDGREFQFIELAAPRPLAHLVYDARVALDNPDFARQIMADPRVDLREMAVTTDTLPVDLPGTRPESASLRDFTRHSPERMTMTVDTPEDALLTLAVVNYPGWHARVDGQPVEVIDANAGLIGVPVQPGENQTIEIYFDSTTLKVGAVISGFALLGWLGLVAAALLRGRKG